FTAMTRMDQNRALSQLAAKTGSPVTHLNDITIRDDHSATQYPDIYHATVAGRPATAGADDQAWPKDAFIPAVAERGAAIDAARGASSAAAAANAPIHHVHDWTHGTPQDSWTSAAVVSDGSYGVPEGLLSSFPVRSNGGRWEIVQ